MEEPVNMIEPVESEQDSLSPFISIWFRPRGTIRRVVETEPTRFVIPIMIVSGIYLAFVNASDNSLGDQIAFPYLLVGSLLGAVVGAVIVLYLGGALFRWSGGLFGGTAESVEVRAAIGWSSVPDIVQLLINLPFIIFFGADWFKSGTTEWMDTHDVLYFFLIITLVGMGLMLVAWRFFLFIKCLAEVHKFSAWRSLASFLVIAIPYLVLRYGIGFIVGG